MTKREGFNTLLQMEVIKDNPEWESFILNELALLDNKGGKRATIREENEEIKQQILKGLEPNKKYLLKEIREAIGLTNYKIQKVNAIVTQLKNVSKLIRIEEKGKAYFYLPTEENVEAADIAINE